MTWIMRRLGKLVPLSPDSKLSAYMFKYESISLSASWLFAGYYLIDDILKGSFCFVSPLTAPL